MVVSIHSLTAGLLGNNCQQGSLGSLLKKYRQYYYYIFQQDTLPKVFLPRNKIQLGKE